MEGIEWDVPREGRRLEGYRVACVFFGVLLYVIVSALWSS